MLVRSLLTFCLLSLLFLANIVVAGTSVNSNAVVKYKQLIDVVHLNDSANSQFVNILFNELDSDNYNGIRAPMYGLIAKLETNNGNVDKAKIALERAISALNKTASHSYQIDALNHISWVYINRGDYASAIYYLQRMADYAYEHKHMRGQAIALNRLGQCYIELGLSSLAFPPLETALNISKQYEFENTELLALLYLANAALTSDKMTPQEILAIVDQATLITKRMNYGEGYIDRLRGLTYQKVPQHDIAQQWLQKSLAFATSEHDVRLLRLINYDLAQFYFIQHQEELALSHAQSSLMYAKRLNHQAGIAKLHYLLSQIYHRQQDSSQAYANLSAYTDFLRSDSNRNAISLLTLMDKRINSLRQQNKMVELENNLLSTDLAAQKAYNERHTTVIWLMAALFVFISLSVSLFIRHRMMSMKVAISMKDALTGAYARSYLKHFLPLVKNTLAKERDFNSSFGIMLIDCDDFKLINDQFGHGGGDAALKAIVTTINKEIRNQDTLFRWGGDEFVLMCQSVSKTQLKEISSRINKAVSNLAVNYGNSEIRPTISIGYALHSHDESFNLDELLKIADDYLYQSKRAGKNAAFGI